jgi:hypothetical protein
VANNNNNYHIEPVEGVSAASNQNALIALQKQSQAEENQWKKALETKNPARVYSCFWLVIQILNHVGLNVTDGAIIAQSQLMDVEHKMQQCMIKISKGLSDIQGNEAGYKFYNSGQGYLFADSKLGLKTNYYNMPEKGLWGVQSSDQASDAYAKDVSSIEDSIKQLYFADNTDASAPSIGDLSKIVNPYVWQNGKDFDMTGFWSQLESKYSGLNNPYGTSFKMVSSNSSDKASLLQQYMYYKAQSTIYTTSSDTVNAAGGDISKLVSFDPPAEDITKNTNIDPMLSQVLSTLNLFKVKPTTQTTAAGSCPLLDAQKDLLELMLEGKNTISRADAQHDAPGVYAALNYAAYNSYWSKAGADKSAQDLTLDQLGGNPFWGATQVDGVGQGAGDVLGNWSTQTNSVQSSIGNDTSTNSSTMQAQTANEGDEVSVGQNAIKALNQYVNSICQNQNNH